MRRVLVPVHLISAVGPPGRRPGPRGPGYHWRDGYRARGGGLPRHVHRGHLDHAPAWWAGHRERPGARLDTECEVRPDWVRAKLLITLTPAVALVAVVAPGLADEAARAHAGATGGKLAFAVGPAVSATLLVVNVVLGTAKPTRLLRRGPASRARSRM
jgi:hypothetical protein